MWSMYTFLIPIEEKLYFSSDIICKISINVIAKDVLYPVKFLNSLKFNDIPHHILRLKINALIILLQNINQHTSFCNDTRLLVTQLIARVIQAKIIISNYISIKDYISCIMMQVTKS